MSTKFNHEKNTEYQDIMNIYNENKEKQVTEWLSFDTLINKPSKQGIIGLFDVKNTSKKCIFKISQHINYLIQHEYSIMKGLNEISNFCPHFCRVFGYSKIRVNSQNNKLRGNPFKLLSKHSIETEILLSEYLKDSHKFSSYIRSKNISENIIYSTIKQVLLGISIAQKKKKFTHYDLHSNNIMIKTCDKDIVFLYVIDKDNQFYIHTNGLYPVIIDFGFSYIDNNENNPLLATLAHTESGFMCDRFDWVSDPKLFLVTVSDEIKNKRNTSTSKKFKRTIHNLFPLKIEMDSGWDKTKQKGATEYIIDLLEDYNDYSKLFEENIFYCFELIQSIIILPLEEQNYNNISDSYVAFLKEWVKIENEISNNFYNLYILKNIVNAARYVHPFYIQNETKDYAIKEFRQAVYDTIKEVADFCNPKKINFEILLCSLLLLAKNIEGVLHDTINIRMKEKNKDYKKLPLSSIDQIYACIEINFPDEYKFNENTSVVIFDCINEKTHTFKPPVSSHEKINNTMSISKGSVIYDLFKNQ
jgi:hypothetical protein